MISAHIMNSETSFTLSNRQLSESARDIPPSSSLHDTLQEMPLADSKDIRTELQPNDEYLPDYIRLPSTDYETWNSLSRPEKLSNGAASPDLANKVRDLDNLSLLRLIMYSVYTQTSKTKAQSTLVNELINRVRLGPNDQSRELLDLLNKRHSVQAVDWFQTDEFNRPSWNLELPHPFIDLLQEYHPFRDAFLYRETDISYSSILPWTKFGYIPFIQTYTESNKHYLFEHIICEDAATYGHLHVIKWARNIGISWDEWTCTAAAKQGDLDTLKWARENGCPWDEWTCAKAAFNGHLEVLKWARENGCPWDEWTTTNAAKKGHADLLKWAIDNGCPRD